MDAELSAANDLKRSAGRHRSEASRHGGGHGWGHGRVASRRPPRAKLQCCAVGRLRTGLVSGAGELPRHLPVQETSPLEVLTMIPLYRRLTGILLGLTFGL